MGLFAERYGIGMFVLMSTTLLVHGGAQNYPWSGFDILDLSRSFDEHSLRYDDKKFLTIETVYDNSDELWLVILSFASAQSNIFITAR